MIIEVETDTFPRYRGEIVGYIGGGATYAVVLIQSVLVMQDQGKMSIPAWIKHGPKLQSFQLNVLEVTDVKRR